MKTYLVALVALTLATPLAFSQEFRAEITGAVTDSSGAGIPGAKVTVTETRTGVKTQTVSGTTGQYTAAFLLPGDYDINVEAQGFKAFNRKGLHVGGGDHPVIDVKLEVGDVSQTIEVRGDAPILKSENGSVGQTITTKEVEDLPSNGGTPMVLAGLSLGVIATSQPSSVLPFASGGAASWSIGGSPSQTNELLIDGSPNGTWDGRLAYSGLKDAVLEVRVKVFDTDAAYGHTGAGTVNQILKSGTNSIHGTAYLNNQPSNMVANNFFSNKAGLATPVTHFNQWGVTAGGPVVIPRVVDGRNRLFWFFGYEGIRDSQPATTFFSVPTDAERNGDFSALLALKAPLSPIVLYDPATAVRNGTTVTRTAFPNNIIPTGRLDKIALKYLAFIAKPNITDPSIARADGFQNFGSNAPSIDGYTNELGRLDWNINARNRTYFNVRHTDYFQSKNDYFSNISTGSYLSRSNWGLALDHVFTVNATNIINVRANFSRMFEDHRAPSAGFDPGSFGFPSYLAANAQSLQLPVISFATNTAFQTLGQNGANTLPSQSLQLFGNWVAVRGNHQIKVGGDIRQYRFNYASFGNATGNFSFSANNWTRQASNSSTTVAMGQDFSEFLLGLPTSGTYDINTSSMFYEYYVAGFVQDDWRIKRNLTLNFGLRLDHDFPWREKWGRTVNGFDTTAVNPLSAAATAAYAKSPVAGLPANAFNVLGGLTFATPGDNAVMHNTSHLLSPRFGFAWVPDRMGGKTVIRGGFAMFVSSVQLSTLQVTGAYSTNPILTQEGFSQATALVSTNDTNLTPFGTLSNPFPNGITRPAGSSAGLGTFAGQTVSFLNPQAKSPYAVRWNFAIQHEIRPSLGLEVVYTGNHSVHLPITYTQLNSLPAQFLSTSPARDQPLITTLTASVANPFSGFQTSNAGATTTAVQLLSKYPQFPIGYSSGAFGGSTGVVENDLNAGSSYFQSLGVGVTKRLSHGLQVITNYMWSKMIERVTWLNVTDAQPEKRISPFFHPHRISMAVVYELPFGRGRRINLQSRLADTVLGGWKVSSVYQWQVGAPITFVNGSTNNPGDYVYTGGDLGFNNREVNTTAFNTALFDKNSANQLQYHIRTFSTAFPSLRQDGINQWDVSVLKQFRITESSRFELRAEAFNAVNHAIFGAPNTTATNSAFGTITTQANRPRLLQLVGRFVF